MRKGCGTWHLEATEWVMDKGRGPMRRRAFLAGSAALVAAGLTRPTAAPAVAPPPAGWLDAVRRDFVLLPDVVQMAGFLLAAHPRPVREAIDRHRQGLDTDPTRYLEQNNRRLEGAVRAAAAQHLGVQASHVALTDSTTMGLGLVYGSIQVREDQEFLATTHDHYATHESLRLRAEASGASLRKIRLYESVREVTREEILERVREGVGEATRVLAVTWVHSSTGLQLPLAGIAQVVAEANAGRAPEDQILFCVDGVHGLGVEAVGLGALGCDIFVAGTHKWLCGPRGTGIVWANARGRAALRPIIPTFSRGAGWGGLMTPGGFHSFEHRWALAQAFEWHHGLDPARVQAHIHALAQQCREGLEAIPRVRLHTPLDPDLSAGICSFDLVGQHPANAARLLRERGIIASHAPYERSYVRLAPMVYTTPEEVDQALEAVEALAG